MKEDIENALKILQQGGIILYPTDTIWGIGCDATNADAVERIYHLKNRKDTRSMLVLLDNPNRLHQYIEEVPEIAWELVEVANKPLTLIYPSAKNLAYNLVAEDNSIGIRIVKDEFCRQLIQRFNKPVVSTSANISGKPAPHNFAGIEADIARKVDYVVKWGQDDVTRRKPSGIIKLGLRGEIKIIRE